MGVNMKFIVGTNNCFYHFEQLGTLVVDRMPEVVDEGAVATIHRACLGAFIFP